MVNVGFIHYKVKWGDTLENISSRYNIDYYSLKYYNHIDDIFVGQILLIPNQDVKFLNKSNIIKRSLEYYLKRHISNKHIFKFNEISK